MPKHRNDSVNLPHISVPGQVYIFKNFFFSSFNQLVAITWFQFCLLSLECEQKQMCHALGRGDAGGSPGAPPGVEELSEVIPHLTTMWTQTSESSLGGVFCTPTPKIHPLSTGSWA